MILGRQVESLLNIEITDKQFYESFFKSVKKRKKLISRFGDANGTRYRQEYLIDLICEDVISDIFSKATVFIAKSVLDMEKEHSTNCQSALTE